MKPFLHLLLILITFITFAYSEFRFKVAINLDLKTAEKQSVPEFIGSVKKLGFNGVCTMRDSKKLEPFIAEANKQGLDVYLVLTNINPPVKLLQVLSKEDKKFLSGKSKLVHSGKFVETFGTEPVEEKDMWMFPAACFDKPESIKYYSEMSKKMALTPGIKGIFYDDLGYQNFSACHCEVSLKLREEYAKAHPELSKEKAVDAFSEESLVKFMDTIIKAGKEAKPDLVAIAGNYPYFKPNTLFPNKVNADWFSIDISWGGLPRWDLSRVKKYAEFTAKEAKTYYKTQNGAIYLGIYGGKDRKPLERINEELEIIKNSGAEGIMVLDVVSILDDEPTAKAVAALLKK